MRIEKINDNQIRCTLTRDDLADRQIKLSELAYGTEKTKLLFHDMMQQASMDFGFEAEDIPLMIEAIPLPNECIVLIITKVEDPEELDTRFSRFAPSSGDDDDFISPKSNLPEGADNVLDLFKHLFESRLKKADSDSTGKASVEVCDEITLTKLYMFHSLDHVIAAAKVLKDYYCGKNTLYKIKSSGQYALVINNAPHTPESFNKICNILAEYGASAKYVTGTEAYMEEHEEIILAKNALQQLGRI